MPRLNATLCFSLALKLGSSVQPPKEAPPFCWSVVTCFRSSRKKSLPLVITFAAHVSTTFVLNCLQSPTLRCPWRARASRRRLLGRFVNSRLRLWSQSQPISYFLRIEAVDWNVFSCRNSLCAFCALGFGAVQRGRSIRDGVRLLVLLLTFAATSFAVLLRSCGTIASACTLSLGRSLRVPAFASSSFAFLLVSSSSLHDSRPGDVGGAGRMMVVGSR